MGRPFGQDSLERLSGFGANALVRFDPAPESFEALPLLSPSAGVGQFLGVPGEVWEPEAAVDRVVLLEIPEGM